MTSDSLPAIDPRRPSGLTWIPFQGAAAAQPESRPLVKFRSRPRIASDPRPDLGGMHTAWHTSHPARRGVSQTDMIAAHDQLGDLRDLVRSAQIPVGTGLSQVSGNPVVWSDHGLAVATVPTALGLESTGMAEDVSILIVTPHAEALAWLLKALHSIFAGLGPDDFMRRLGEAAYWHQEDFPEDHSAEGLLGSVLNEASAVLRELAGNQVFRAGG